MSHTASEMTHLSMRRERTPTAKQMAVLHLLADGPKSARHIEYDGFGFTREQAYGILRRLYSRALVEPTGWNAYGEREYALTERGWIAEASAGE